MEITSVASAVIAARVGQMQMALAAKMLRMNAQAALEAVKVLEAAQRNFDRLANVASGLGGNLDISA
jgi:hypothetical protein